MTRLIALLAAGTAAILTIVPAPAARAQAADPGWPREVVRQDARLVMYQPQVDEWKDFRSLQVRMAVALTPKQGAKPLVGAVGLHADTLVNQDEQIVTLTNLKFTRINFPSLDDAAAEQARKQLQAFVPQSITVSLHRLVASTPKPESAPAAQVRNEPPVIFVSTTPALLVFVDGKPVTGKVAGTQLEFVVNTSLPLLLDKAASRYYLLAGEQWMTAVALPGPWSATQALPADMNKLVQDPQWAEMKKFIPARPAGKTPPPRIFYSEAPAEVILFEGKPAFKRVQGTGLLYASNTVAPLLLHEATKQYYYLTAGRWFRSGGVEGPWTYATADLPEDFKRIPPDSPAGNVLAAVPGTEEAKDAVLMAQVPVTMQVSPAAAAQVKVVYDGAPRFEPIQGTSLSYAVNTVDKVIRVGDLYYLCLQGVWFRSATPQGPWEVAPSVPKEIYSIPPSSPIYNVTYVTQVTTTDGAVESSYTAGYMGAFIVGVGIGYTVCWGSGWYYPPYFYYPPYGYPIYRPYPMPYGVPIYNPATGAYGWGQAVYGPHGGAARAATYNPYTGTYARGATAYGPYGSRSVAQAYNPYTGTYAATRQGSSPSGQWGSTVVAKGGQSVQAKHVTGERGTVGAIEGSKGGQAIGVDKAGPGGSGMVGKTAGGDYYAAKDGNVYRNTGSGWQQYENGNWNAVQAERPSQLPATQPGQGASASPRPAQQPSYSGGAEVQNLQREQAARERGTYQSQQLQRGPAMRGGGGGRGRR